MLVSIAGSDDLSTEKTGERGRALAVSSKSVSCWVCRSAPSRGAFSGRRTSEAFEEYPGWPCVC